VVTEEPEEQRILAFLRYQKNESGYRKLSTREANDLLKTRHSDYLYFSKTRDVTLLHGVHRDRIVHHHQPRKRLLADQRPEPLDETLWQDAYARRGCTLSYEEYRWHEQRKYNKAAIG
jgi:predicted nucleotidyltransferase